MLIATNLWRSVLSYRVANKSLAQPGRKQATFPAFYRTWTFFTAFTRVHHLSLTYFLTPWCRVLLEKLTVLQPVKKFPAFHGTRRFITALTSVRQLSLSWASPIQSTYPHPTSWRSILILSTHLCLGLPSGLLPSGFPSKILHTPPVPTLAKSIHSSVHHTIDRRSLFPSWSG